MQFFLLNHCYNSLRKLALTLCASQQKSIAPKMERGREREGVRGKVRGNYKHKRKNIADN